MFGGAIVKVNTQNAQRQGTYFRKQLPVSNSGLPMWANVDIEVTLLGAGVDGGNILTTRNGHRFMASSPETLSYDDDGNLVSDGRWLYSWDGENRLIAMETNAIALSAGIPKRRLEFAYDGGSRRIRKQVYDWDVDTSSWTLNNERRFVYDQWNLVAEVDASGDLIKSHVWGQDLSQTAQGAGGVGGLLWSTDHEKGHTHFVSYDGNGNVTAMVNASTAAVEARYDYNAFGETVMVEGGEIAEGNTFRFSTKYQDAETGLYYYGYRYYSAELGRWLGRDPIEERGGLNLYGMVGNDAVNRWDYLGLLGLLPIPHPEFPTPTPDGGNVWPNGEYTPPGTAPSEPLTLDNIASAFCNYSEPAPKCSCDDSSEVRDPYPVKAKSICIDFVKRYQFSIAVISTASCLVQAESQCQKLSCCSERNKCRLKAHVTCYASRAFIPFLGLPDGGADVGWNMLLKDSQCK